MALAFGVRWLMTAGLSRDEAQRRARDVYERARRYPFPAPWAYCLASLAIEWCFPLFVLRRICRASSLSPQEFETLEKKLHHSSCLLLRIIYTFIRLPLWEQISLDKKPVAKSPHPLSNKVSSPDQQSEFDIIVIGSGAGGAPLAWQLSRSGLKVAIVESGSLVEPQTTSYTLEHYYVQQALTASTKGGILPIFAGNTVGGTTSINSGTCLRPPQERLQEWDQKVGTNFASGILDPYFDTVDKVLGTTVPPKSLLGRSAALFEHGLEVLGRRGAYVLPRSAPDCAGSGRCCFVCPTGAKLSTDLAFLPEAIEHGCTLFAETRATNITETAGGITVTARHHDHTYQLRCHQLILAAGPFGTPQLIRHNRLGSKWRHAGRHLRVHPATKVFAYFADPVHGETGVPQGLGYQAPELPRVVFEGIFTPKSTAGPLLAAVGERYRWWLDRYDNLASFGLMLRERSEGRLWNIGSWPLLRYRMSPADVRDMMAGFILCGEVFLAAGAKRVLLPVVGRKNEYDSMDELRRVDPRDYRQAHFINSGFHPQGTASIGRLVDTNLALMGTRNIYVCDVSVFPASPGVNPQITIMGLSLYLAEKLHAMHLPEFPSNASF